VLRELALAPLAEWPTGVYRMMTPALPLHVVVVSELPRERETLMLRLMGAKRVLREALVDLQRLPSGAWERRAAADAIGVLRSFTKEAAALHDRDEEAIIMGASEAYERIKDEGRQEGRREGLQEGVAEGERRILLRQLEVRFGSLPEQIVARVQGADATQLERWAERVMHAASPEEVIES
jgi:flagellar biosynthesis/type III secretory pathway protein FliH